MAGEKKRLQQVEELVLRDHYHLSATDICFFWGEYTARKGYSHSDTNDIIGNLKKDLDRKGKPEWKWKGRAIDQVAAIFKATTNQDNLKTLTICPMPPSKVKTDPLYDDR